MATRFEITQRIERYLERLDAHDELTASAIREEVHRQHLGLNGLRSVEGSVITILSAYEAVGGCDVPGHDPECECGYRVPDNDEEARA
jgi:hypothetical protein